MLSFSPDWDARCCYLVVLALGIGSAWFQVRGRLEALKSRAIFAWSLLWTWLVYSIYLAIPLILFWLLDRTGALNDTSLFAAILVGLAYPAVVAGTTGIKPSEGIGGVLGWLNRAADTLTTKAAAFAEVEDRLFRNAVIAELVSDPARYNQMLECASFYADSPSAMTAELATAQTPAEKADIVYGFAASSAKGLQPVAKLVKGWKLPGVVSPFDKADRWRIGYATALATLVCLIAWGVGFRVAGRDWFLIWRLTKPGVTARDLHRNSEALKSRISPASPEATRLRDRLLAALLLPELDLQRADRILSLLLFDRGNTGEPRFRAASDLLLGGLRAGSVDVRARTHHALLLLADESQGTWTNQATLESRLNELRNWKPLATESPIDLEGKWKLWKDWWSDAGKQAVPAITAATAPDKTAPAESPPDPRNP